MEKTECQCNECKRACEHNPGWFMPGEVEIAAQHLGLPLQEFFEKNLGVNWWEAGDEIENNIFVLAPALVGEEPGYEYPGDPRGTCVFYKDGKCSIHAVKPFECAQFLHGQEFEMVHERHKAVAMAWQDRQEQIKELLGHEPEASEFTSGLFGMLGLW